MTTLSKSRKAKFLIFIANCDGIYKRVEVLGDFCESENLRDFWMVGFFKDVGGHFLIVRCFLSRKAFQNQNCLFFDDRRLFTIKDHILQDPE